MQAAVEVRDLTKIYDPSPRWMRFLLRSAITESVTAIGGMSLSIDEGEICAIVGPNGAGKSTLFRVLTGLTTPTSGIARVHGIDVSNAPRSVRALVGFVPAGDQTLQLRLSCADNLMFHGQLAGLRGEPLRRRIAEVLGIVGLSRATDVVGFALSAGMRARLQLARAMLHYPSVLILDEPTAAVDPVGSYELLTDVERVAAESGVAVLLSSHRLEEIEALRQRVVLMDQGRIVYDGHLDTIPRAFNEPTVTLRFASPTQRDRALMRLGGHKGIRLDAAESVGQTEIAVAGDVAIGPLIAKLDGMLDGLTSVEETRPSLREVIYGILRQPQSGREAGGDQEEQIA